MKKSIALTVLFFISWNFWSQGFGFGQNKPIYKDFDFKVYETEHFELYSYLRNDSVRTRFLYDAEEWYAKHSWTLSGVKFDEKVPMILYNNHADFQQTTAIMGSIGVGTGGVTEALKTRVVMPLRPSYGQTKHVLGHELVHAFQYTLVKNNPELSFQHLANVPLWMVEGMAEYLSIGRYDAHTAMWMRDAVLNGFFPRYKDMYKPKYFPYRYGQNFWAFFGATFGDDQIERYYTGALKVGPEQAMDSLYGISIDTFFGRWKTANENYYKQFLPGRDTVAIGKVLFDEKNSGTVNISPSVSPDGKKMIFLSEKQIISLDLYLADLETGKTKLISSKSLSNHIDAIDAYESAGAWSPDSKYFVFIIFKKGKTQLAVVDVAKRKVTDTWEVRELQSFSNPVWSPDGKSILLLGQKDGYTDLFLYKIDSKRVTRLTNDPYAEMTPSWSADGKKIVFSTDYYYIKHGKYPVHYHLGILDVETLTKTYPGVFPGADNLNPVFDNTGNNIYFLSDREGFRDLYRYETTTGKVFQMTKFFTGISGITKFSPAISVNNQTGEIVYNLFNKHQYAIYKAGLSDFYQMEVNPTDINKKAALLPPPVNVSFALKQLKHNRKPTYGLVDALILSKADSLRVEIKERPYKPKFKLDYISNMGFGMTTSIYGTGMQGGVNMIFSDILGKNLISAAISLNGEIYDFAGMFLYFNQGKRRQIGAYVSHFPYMNYTQGAEIKQISGDYYYVYKYYLIRMFEDKIGAFRLFPLSRTQRLEAGGSFARYSFRIDSYNYYYPYDPVSQSIYPQAVGFERKKEDAPDGFNLGEINGGYVGDNSVFGMTAPMKGMRYRLGYQRYFGAADFNTATLDFRYYKYLKPFTFAWRFMHVNRFGKNLNNNIIYPFFITYEYFIRGYTFDVLSRYVQTTNDNLTFQDLMGNKILVGNFEVRLPFTGPERLAAIKSSFLFSDLSFFLDAGWVWEPGDKLSLDLMPVSGERRLWASTGVALRINLFGQIIIQPYFSRPLTLKNYSKWSFGFNFYPGF
jgi:hypothetical protein